MTDHHRHRVSIPLALVLIIAPLLVWAWTISEMCFTSNRVNSFSGPITEGIKLQDPDRVRLAVMGDSRTNFAAFEAILADARTKADAALIMGDLVDRSNFVQYAYLKSELDRAAADLPIFAGLGNHDLDRPEGSRRFQQNFGAVHFWWRFGHILWISIDNVDKANWRSELDWLRQTLKEQAREGDQIYLIMHKPPDPGVDPDFYGLNVKKSKQLCELIKDRPKLHILAGHLHGYLEYDFCGAPVIINGEAGARQQTDTPNYSYLLQTCDRNHCEIKKVDLGDVPQGMSLARKFFVRTMFWVYPIVSLAFVLILLLRITKDKMSSKNWDLD